MISVSRETLEKFNEEAPEEETTNSNDDKASEE